MNDPSRLSAPPRLITFSGREVDLLRPSADQVDLVDVAWSLAHQGRYLGHTRVHYSVGQHSLAMARAAAAEGYGADVVAWCLLHDAAEAYLGDLVWPVTASGLGGDVRELEHRWSRVIVEACGLSWPEPPEVKELDLECIEAEAEILLPPWTSQQAPRRCRPSLRRAIGELVWQSTRGSTPDRVAAEWATMVADLVPYGVRPDLGRLSPGARGRVLGAAISVSLLAMRHTHTPAPVSDETRAMLRGVVEEDCE